MTVPTPSTAAASRGARLRIGILGLMDTTPWVRICRAGGGVGEASWGRALLLVAGRFVAGRLDDAGELDPAREGLRRLAFAEKLALDRLCMGIEIESDAHAPRIWH